MQERVQSEEKRTRERYSPELPYQSPRTSRRAGTVPDEGDEDGDAGIEHAGYVLGLEAVRDGEDGLLVNDDAGGVPALGAGALRALFGLRTNRRMVSIS
jgi:hypothetical protein